MEIPILHVLLPISSTMEKNSYSQLIEHKELLPMKNLCLLILIDWQWMMGKEWDKAIQMLLRILSTIVLR